MKKSTSATKILFLQDIGILCFMCCIFIACLIVIFESDSLMYQNLILLAGLFLTGMLVVLHTQTAATVVTAFEILSFSAYKLYQYAAQDVVIEKTAYLWPFLLLGVLGGLNLFIWSYASLENVNHILNRQVEDLTVVDTLTGLQNLKSMYWNLERIMALSMRHDTDFGLMIIRLRYPEELRKVLTRREYEGVCQKIAIIVENVLRIEDSIYSMDKDGSVGVIYYANEEGAGIVKKRLLDALGQKGAFDQIRGENLRIEFRIAYKQYSSDMKKDAMHFKQLVEGELAYEV